MKKNLFEIGAKFNDEWSSDNKTSISSKKDIEIKEPNKHQLNFSKEKRRGKIVTIVKPFYLEKSTLQSLLKSIKKKLGIGGSVKDNSLEFQGEKHESIKKELETLHYRFKS